MDDEAPRSGSPAGSNVQRRLDVLEQTAKILSLVGIPVILGVVGWAVQKRIQDQAVSRDFVQLAVSLLRDRDTVAVGRELRRWAVDLLDKSAPVQLDTGARQVLIQGRGVLPAVLPGPAATVEQASLVRQLAAQDRAIRVEAYRRLLQRFPGATEVVTLLLDQLAGGELDGNGIFNTLSTLSGTTPAAWRPAQLARADTILARLRERARGGDASVGSSNLARADTLELHLARIRPLVK